ncbi:preprotein translocase subunit YajC [Francisella tularensis]|uniref:Sec translocon accessory complex subunit YajC n=5 Tax=Francisella tularensis TaxID=263 RepID=Q5NFV2_FRATT|nr:preprotein translocase subunit YajC [Francisella tularensis]ACD31139.1 preprotein translocase, YajC subunit [Francisella tularensis subsp. mediasiatica FSC147]AFX70526.1 preprotein translocase family protein [Francisella tularensis subsp. holarctica F92]EBA52443.1 preprotein translocase family protein [Francisella tularensis subsp. holarctica 257]ABI82760.1 preprotein translocase subunit [Francisella tularensis subsp. holarctica OSU18]ABK89982.1 preprotein translocase family protein [Franci
MRKLLLSLSAIVLFVSTSFAQGAEQAAGSPLSSILMLVVFFAIFWFLLIRPQQKKNKELRKMLSELSKGDEVVTNGGMVGKIAKIDETFVDLEVADNVTVKIQRNAVANILPKGATKA